MSGNRRVLFRLKRELKGSKCQTALSVSDFWRVTEEDETFKPQNSRIPAESNDFVHSLNNQSNYVDLARWFDIFAKISQNSSPEIPTKYICFCKILNPSFLSRLMGIIRVIIIRLYDDREPCAGGQMGVEGQDRHKQHQPSLRKQREHPVCHPWERWANNF